MHRLATWRLEVFVVVLAALEVVSVLVTAEVSHRAVALVVTLLSVLVLLGARWQPLAATVAAFSALTVSLAVQPTSTTAQFFGTLATFAIAGAVNREREAVVAWCAGAAMLGYAAWVDPYGGGAPDFLLSLAFGTTMWGAGLVVARRGRHVRAAQDQARADRARHERDTAAAVAQERAAIARELHDVVSHGLSVVVVQSVAARSRLRDIDTSAVETSAVQTSAVQTVDRHLAAVEETAREALSEMRRMLGLLQQGSETPAVPAPPAPGLAHLQDLVDRVMTGQGPASVRLECTGDLPAGVELTIYRLVQEGLTNVVKHAPGAAVEVAVVQHAGAVDVAVTNGPARRAAEPTEPAGGGHGLVGVRERVSLYDGQVRAQPTTDGFCLAATLPLEDADSSRTTSSATVPIGTA
jgi:signal transduction histidine kinase